MISASTADLRSARNSLRLAGHESPPLGSIRARLQESAGRFVYGLADWTWYLDLTFSQRMHPERAGKVLRDWAQDIARNYVRHHVPLVWTEEQQRREAVHFHALIATPQPDCLDDKLLGYLWRTAHRHAEFNRVRRYDPAKGGAWYVAKSGVIDFNVACPRIHRACKRRKGHCAAAPSAW